MQLRPAHRTIRTTIAAVAITAVLAGLPAPTQAKPVAAATPVDYCVGQCDDIVTPGQNGNATFTDLLLFKGFGTRPPHFSDSLKPYENLVWNSQGITDDALGGYFDDASFGVKTGDVAEHDPAARGRHDRAGQVARHPAHHRHHTVGNDVRRGFRRGAGPAVRDGRVPASRPWPADPVRGRCAVESRVRAGVLADRAVQRSRSAEAVRRRRREVRRRRREDAAGHPGLGRRGQPLHQHGRHRVPR